MSGLHILDPDKATPENLLASALDNSDEFETILIIAKYKDGDMNAGWSEGANTAELLGLCEVAKIKLVAKRLEYEE